MKNPNEPFFAIVVGGIQRSFGAFDAGQNTAQQSKTAELIEVRNAR